MDDEWLQLQGQWFRLDDIQSFFLDEKRNQLLIRLTGGLEVVLYDAKPHLAEILMKALEIEESAA